MEYINPVLARKRTEYINKSRWKYNMYRGKHEDDYAGFLDMIKGAVRWAKGKMSSTPVSPEARKVMPNVAEKVARRMPILRRGSRGKHVEILQKLLNKVGYRLTVDGIFGRNTEKAVKSFQKRSGLVVDGIVGTNTWTALFKVAGVPKIPKAPAKVPRPTPFLPSPPSPQPLPQPSPPTPAPSPAAAPFSPAKAGLVDILMKNWIWIAVAGAMLITTVILVRKR